MRRRLAIPAGAAGGSTNVTLIHRARFAFVLALALCLAPATGFAQRILRYTDHEPLGGMRTKFISEVFFAALEKESGGRLRVSAQWDSAVATGYAALKTIGVGQAADLGVVVPEYTANELPLQQIFKGFMKGPAGQRQVDFFRRAYGEIPAFPAELRRNGVVPVFLATGYPVAFFGIKPLNSLDDIKGDTWRTASFWHRDFLANAGAKPVTIPWGQGVFDALKAKTLDGLMVNIDSGVMLDVHKAAPNVLASRDLRLGHVYVVAMNAALWDGLEQQDRAAVGRAAEAAYRTLGATMDASFAAMVADLDKAGIRTRVLSPTEVAAFETATQYRDVQTAWARAQEAKGVADAVAVTDKVRALIAEAMR